jgi:hypothetical protein
MFERYRNRAVRVVYGVAGAIILGQIEMTEKPFDALQLNKREFLRWIDDEHQRARSFTNAKHPAWWRSSINSTPASAHHFLASSISAVGIVRRHGISRTLNSSSINVHSVLSRFVL